MSLSRSAVAAASLLVLLAGCLDPSGRPDEAVDADADGPTQAAEPADAAKGELPEGAEMDGGDAADPGPGEAPGDEVMDRFEEAVLAKLAEAAPA